MLAVVEGCGQTLIPALLDPHADPDALLRGPSRLPPAARRRLRDPDLPARAAEWRAGAARHAQTVLTPADTDYPGRLRDAPLRPLVLFVRGDLARLCSRERAVAIVGSRTPTAYGCAAARDFATSLARAGFTLWSGLAAGIDAIAHRTALALGTPTVAVLAGGLDRVYPAAHAGLAADIEARDGLLVAESPPGAQARRGHFPRRNRLLATAVDAVLVVEAGRASGSLHTVRFAADAGVDVFAVPGPYTSPRSVGCHQLIADGAQIASDPQDLLRRLGADLSRRGVATTTRVDLSADALAIVSALQQGPRPTDLVRRETALEAGAFLRALLALTQADQVQTLPGDLLAIRAATDANLSR